MFTKPNKSMSARICIATDPAAKRRAVLIETENRAGHTGRLRTKAMRRSSTERARQRRFPRE
jgi:hypothetical protein